MATVFFPWASSASVLEPTGWAAWANREGLAACGRLVAREGGPFCFGAAPTMADLCLVPQVYNARRLNVPLDKFPKIVAIDTACLALPAFDRAHPENQPDAE